MDAKGYGISLMLAMSVFAHPTLAQHSDQPRWGSQIVFPRQGDLMKSSPAVGKGGLASGEVEDDSIVLETVSTTLATEVKPIYRLSPKQLWNKAVKISQRSLVQHQRFVETGQPMMIDQDGVYYCRDLFSYTKGVLLASFFDHKVDVGLYKRRYVSPDSHLTGRALSDYGAERPGEGNLFSGGRQIFVGVRVDLNKLFKRH